MHHGSIKLREAKSVENENAKTEKLSREQCYLNRPKSWGEFQNNLKTFHSIAGPGKAVSSERRINNLSRVADYKQLHRPSNKQKEGMVFRTKQIFEPNATKSDGFCPRPLSGVLLPSPYQKPLKHELVPCGRSPTGTQNFSETTEQSCDAVESVDIPSLEFEEALESQTDKTSDDENIYHQHFNQEHLDNDLILEAQLPSGATLSFLSQISAKPVESVKTDGGFSAISSSRSIRHHTTAHDKIILNAETDHVHLAYTSRSTCPNDGKADEDVSFQIDAGEKSDTDNNQMAIDGKFQALFKSEISSIKRKSYSPTAPKKWTDVSTSLRSSLYDESDDNFCSSVSSYSLTSKASSLHAEEIPSEPEITTNSYAGDLSAEDSTALLKDKHLRVLPMYEQRKVTRPKTEQQENSDLGTLSDSSDSYPALIKKTVLYFEQLNTRTDPLKSSESKDDFGVSTRVPCDVSSSNNNDHTHKDIHSTWPRRVKSKRRQDHEEADELLRRFREMSEMYRSRFRNIYEETRRKIEETMFGLRVAMARNGYSSKFCASKTD